MCDIIVTSAWVLRGHFWVAVRTTFIADHLFNMTVMQTGWYSTHCGNLVLHSDCCILQLIPIRISKCNSNCCWLQRYSNACLAIPMTNVYSRKRVIHRNKPCTADRLSILCSHTSWYKLNVFINIGNHTDKTFPAWSREEYTLLTASICNNNFVVFMNI